MRVEQIGLATLYLGDCLELLPTLGEVDAVVTDPPYGVRLGDTNNGKGMERGQGAYLGFEDTPDYVMAVCVPAIKQCIELYGRVVATIGNRNMFLYPKPDDMGVWYNPAGTGVGRWGFNCASPIFFYGKDPRAGKSITSSSTTSGHRGRGEIIDHPCPKPIAFMEWMVNKASLSGEIILDPFMGSGTTGVASMNLGRKFIGIEIEPKYFDIACRRIEDTQRQAQMFDYAP